MLGCSLERTSAGDVGADLANLLARAAALPSEHVGNDALCFGGNVGCIVCPALAAPGARLTCVKGARTGLCRLYFDLATFLGNRPPALPNADARAHPKDVPAVGAGDGGGGAGGDDLV